MRLNLEVPDELHRQVRLIQASSQGRVTLGALYIALFKEALSARGVVDVGAAPPTKAPAFPTLTPKQMSEFEKRRAVALKAWARADREND